MKCLIANALLAFLATTSAVNAEPLVVVEARGIPITSGSTLESHNVLELKLGQHLTLITQSGSTIRLDGPYNGDVAVPGSGGVDLYQTLRVLITQQQSVGGEYGVSRGTAATSLPDPWFVDVSHSGNGCLLENELPVFWRPDAKASVKITIAPVDRSWKAEANWPAGESKITFAEVPISGGQTYLVDLDGEEFAITTKLLPTVLANDNMRAAWMANQGCALQAQALVKMAK